jgi:hypothetical protein
MKGTIDLGLVHGGIEPFTLACYCDSDRARDTVARRSRTGYVFMMNGGAMIWKSQHHAGGHAGKHNGGGGAVGGEIGPQPPSQVPLDAALSDGQQISERRERGEGPCCRRSNEKLCLTGRGSAAKDPGHVAAGHM